MQINEAIPGSQEHRFASKFLPLGVPNHLNSYPVQKYTDEKQEDGVEGLIYGVQDLGLEESSEDSEIKRLKSITHLSREDQIYEPQ